MNLYRVKLKGIINVPAGNTAHGHPYVLADNPTEALEKVQSELERLDIGFRSDRVMDSITLLAVDAEFSPSEFRLFL